MSRHAAKGPVAAWEVEGLRLIAPHLRRAVTISNLFELQTVERAMFRWVLDGLRHPVMIVDEDSSLLYSNGAAEQVLALRSGISTKQGRIKLDDPAAHAALAGAVRLAADDEAKLAQRGIGIPLPRRSESPLHLHLMPLQRGAVRSGLVQRAVAALFVVPALRSPDPPTEAAVLIYDLTQAEAQVFAMLAAGNTVEKAALALGIAKSTARTHLLHVFQKTGCKRQAELVALAERLSPPI